MIGARLGYHVQLCLPSNVSIERKKTILAYGAEIIETDPLEGADGAFFLARELAEKNPDQYFYPDQYNNDANWRAHYTHTAEEIWKQTQGRITHFVAEAGTSGTFVGNTRRLRELKPEVQCILMQPDSPFHGIEGVRHMASTLAPGIFDPNLADCEVEVGTERAYEMVKLLAAGEGLRCVGKSNPTRRMR